MPNYNDAPWADSSLGRIETTPTEDGWNPEYLFQYVYVVATDALMRYDGPFNLGADAFQIVWREATYVASVPFSVPINTTGEEWDQLGLNGIISIGNGSMSATMHVDTRLMMDFHLSVTWGTTTTFDQASLYSWFGPQYLGGPGAPTSPNLALAPVTLGGWGYFFDSSALTIYPLDVNGYGFLCPNMSSAGAAAGATSTLLPAPANGDTLIIGYRTSMARPIIARKMYYRQ